MENLEDLLKADPRSKREISEAAGLPHYYASDIARGKHSPRVSTVAKIAQALGISVARVLHALAETAAQKWEAAQAVPEETDELGRKVPDEEPGIFDPADIPF